MGKSDECPECGGEMYVIQGMTQFDQRDGIRNARICGECFSLFGTHAHGFSLQGKITEPYKADGKARMLLYLDRLARGVATLRKEVDKPKRLPRKKRGGEK